MSGSGFDKTLGIDGALLRELPHGGLPGNDSRQMAFLNAATEGDLRRLRELASGKDAEEMAWLADASIQTMGPFQVAANLGRVDVVRCMVEELGFDINAGSKVGITALAAASLGGQMGAMKYSTMGLIQIRKTIQAAFLFTMPHNLELTHICLDFDIIQGMVALLRHEEAARLLLRVGASVDIDTFNGTPLHIAAVHGKTGVMKVLLEHHADPNKLSKVLGTPLTAALDAILEGLPEAISLKCVKLPVEAGADVNSINPDTPLVLATMYGLTDCIEYLLKAGADPNIPANHCGDIPIQLAARHGRRKHVELLFPLTSPIRTISNWTVEGIIGHTKSKCSKTRDEHDDNNTKAQLKLCGKEAVERKDYCRAAMFYTKAIELDPSDAKLYSNRSFCYVQMLEGGMALVDANTCIELSHGWIKGYYRKGVALMFLKEYKKAHDVFMAGLELEPGNRDMKKALGEAVEAMERNARFGKA